MERLQASIDGHGEYVEYRNILFRKIMFKFNGK
jgi:hypothetical protein